MTDWASGLLLNIIAGLLVAGMLWVRTALTLTLGRRDPRLPSLLFAGVLVAWILASFFTIMFAPHFKASPAAVATSFLVTSVLAFLLVWREVSQFWEVGLRGADRTIASGLDYMRALRLCQNNLEFLGTGASKLTKSPEFERALLRCRPDQPIRLLLRKPSDDNLTAAAKRAGRERDEYKNLVLQSLRSIAEFREKRGLNLEIRFYSEPPLFRLMFIDHSICLMSYNVFGEGDGSQLPQLHLVKASLHEREIRSFYYPLELYFKTLWEKSETWDFAEFIKQP